MRLRDWVESSPTVASGVAVAGIVGALAWILTEGLDAFGGSDTTGKAWYVGLETGEVFTVPTSQPLPIKSPNGNDAVRVAMFSCGGCDDADKRFIGYYERLSAAATGGPGTEGVPVGQLTPEAFDVASGTGADDQFDRPPLNERQLRWLRNDNNWYGTPQGRPRRPGAAGPSLTRRRKRIRAAAVYAGVCSGDAQPDRCDR